MSNSAQVMPQLRQVFNPGGQTQQPAEPGTATDVTNTKVDNLDALEEAIAYAEESLPASPAQTQNTMTSQAMDAFAQVIPQATLDSTDTLNPQQAATALKETESAKTPDVSPVESAAGVQAVEYEPKPELPPEVEGYLQQVEEHPDKLPDEIVVADGTTQFSTTQQPAKKPVIVLPITPEMEKAGASKPVHWSIRWLVEFSRKIMKMFVGEVVYRPEPTSGQN